MKTITKINSVFGLVIVAATLMFTVSCQKENSILPGNLSDPDEQSIVVTKMGPVVPPRPGVPYSLLSKKWWQWALELPLQGHPFIDDPSFDVTVGQSGQTWFLAAVLDTVVRNCTIPAGKELFVGMLNNEASNLEGLGTTYSDQLANAKFVADHIINVFATVDGIPLNNVEAFRVASPQFHFTAPTPWIFGTTGGQGTAVADGYYLLLKPLSTGSHIIHYGGAFHFSIAEGDPFDFDAAMDMTYNLTVL